MKKTLEEIISEHLEDYEVRSDNGDYRPNEKEMFILEDFMAGLLEDFKQAGFYRIEDLEIDEDRVFETMKELLLCHADKQYSACAKEIVKTPGIIKPKNPSEA